VMHATTDVLPTKRIVFASLQNGKMNHASRAHTFINFRHP
jgi:hypothetical protein